MKKSMMGMLVSAVAATSLSAGASELAGLKVGDPIPGRYIVVLQNRETLATALGAAESVTGRELAQVIVDSLGREIADDVTHVYGDALLGFATALEQDEVEFLGEHPLVDYVEQDQVFGISVGGGEQAGATWGLDRSDARNGLDNTYHYSADGTGYHAYILDTGIRASHQEFTDRIGHGADCAGQTGFSFGCSEGGLFRFGPYAPSDGNGHGTHVAGTVGGTQYGIAKNVTVHAVKVLGDAGIGSGSSTIAGIDWVIANPEAGRPAVINMSLGGGASTATDAAVARAVAADITVVVAAGNDDTDACSTSPARAPAAITVASTDRADSRSGFSNWGSCVDIFAPGSSIVSASYLSNTGTSTLSGTSMAAPHVAGAIALFGHPTPVDSLGRLMALATQGVVKDVQGSPNLLLFNGGALVVAEEQPSSEPPANEEEVVDPEQPPSGGDGTTTEEPVTGGGGSEKPGKGNGRKK